jgi:DNA repair protein RecN (Recombination protein N)
MLTSLQVHNFALIEDVCIDFTPGFNVFTGETGAGKSILIDAFGITLGSRASLDYIRKGTDSCWVQAVFDIEGLPKVAKLLAEMDIENQESTLFMRRKLFANGKSQAFVNDRQVPASFLSKLGEALVDIHGQHENQALLRPNVPLEIIDTYGGEEITDAREAYYTFYVAFQKAVADLEKLLNADANQQERLAQLERENTEIESANVKVGEDEQIREKAKKLNSHSKLLGAVNIAHTALDGTEEEGGGVLALLTEGKEALDKVKDIDSELAKVAEEFNSAWLSLDDIRQTLSDYLSSDEFDPAMLDTLQERLDLLFRLKQKYGGSLETVLEHLEKNREEYDSIVNLDKKLKEAKEHKKKLEIELEDQAGVLSNLRQKAASKFTAQVTEHMKDLGMAQGVFQADFAKAEEFGPLGSDRIEFQFSANLGVEPKPLQKIISGGELSRVALAIKAVLLARFGVPTMIFDEIDTGVGGVTAQKMAEKIAIIAKKRQVICITHLAQIASFADNHLYIYKEVKNNSTVSLVEPLGNKEQVREIMRMTGGTNASEAAKENAVELLAMAAKIKKTL